MNTDKLTAPLADLRYKPSQAMTISAKGGNLIYKPMQYILESNGIYVKSVSKDEITLTKKKEEAKQFDSLDAMNHKVFIEMVWSIPEHFNILEA